MENDGDDREIRRHSFLKYAARAALMTSFSVNLTIPLKEGRVEAVLSELATHREADEVVEAEAAVRRCERYLKERLECLDYKSAIAADLPIGSGEIEAGHRKVVQARLKLSGTWWKEDSAEKMLALRTCRANRDWESYWKQQRQAQA